MEADDGITDNHGELEFSRRIYATEGEASRKAHVYLLDEVFGLDIPRQMSPML